MDLAAIQAEIDAKFGEQDRKSGLPFLAMVLLEEVGEVCEAVRKGDRAEAAKEAVDVVFIALALANAAGGAVEPALVSKFLAGDPTASWTDVPGDGG